MKLAELFESVESTDRLLLKVTGDWKQRVFIDATLKPEHKNWMEVEYEKISGKDKLIVELTVDIDSATDARMNHVYCHDKGNGYAGEVIKWAEGKLKQQGVKHVSCYIEHVNGPSQTMISKLGYERGKYGPHGAYWSKSL
jgi:hypothetical protein